jgi:two-component system, sensor histidine kinase RegB
VSAPGPSSSGAIGLPWLIRLRWGAVVGQLATLLAARYAFDAVLPWGWLVGLVAVTALTNLALALVPHVDEHAWLTPTTLVVDVAVLTGMLAASGGPDNPFTVFFLVHVGLAAVLLGSRATWAIVALTIVAYGALYLSPVAPLLFADVSPPAAEVVGAAPCPACATDERAGHASHGGHGIGHADGSPWSLHLVGMWVAYALAAAFVAYFVARVSAAVRERDRQLALIASQAAETAAQNERLAVLSEFAANAAHELGTPLATISLAAGELLNSLKRGATGDGVTGDAALIRDEVARCRRILSDLSTRSGGIVGEMPARMTAEALVRELLSALPVQFRAGFAVEWADDAARRAEVVAPRQALTQVLVNLVRNGFDATPVEGRAQAGTVSLRVEIGQGDRLCLCVLDHGEGLPAEVRDRLGAPFLTTKRNDGGLGLGIYLAQTYAQRAGGTLTFSDRPGGGTAVELCLPRDVLVQSQAPAPAPRPFQEVPT